MDKSAFVEYWNEAVMALIYNVHQLKGPVTAAEVDRLWKRELLERRFFSRGIRHGAAAWLDGLEEHDPAKAQKLRSALNSCSLHVGLGAMQAGAGAMGAAAAAGGSLLLSRGNVGGKIGGVVAGMIGLGLLAKAGKDVCDAVNGDKLTEQIRKAAAIQLEEICGLL